MNFNSWQTGERSHLFGLQNAPFCIAKRTILECKTATFAMQNWQFWNAKSAVLERKTHRFGKQSAHSKVLESELFAYYQALIIQLNRKPFLCSSPLGRPEGNSCRGRIRLLWRQKGLIALCKPLAINAFNGIFVLTHYFDAALIGVHSHEKSGSDRKCINIHFNNSGLNFPNS